MGRQAQAQARWSRSTARTSVVAHALYGKNNSFEKKTLGLSGAQASSLDRGVAVFCGWNVEVQAWAAKGAMQCGLLAHGVNIQASHDIMLLWSRRAACQLAN
ncbi:hypothetical protein PG997_007030 [Apiospora hydei]|uniref:Uncharacterized protein n=1 Tax=Apiospora hydei TaxID=1337664 RepID=A0ABR1WS99_9PEZI